MRVNAIDVYNLLRVYAEDYGNMRSLYAMYDELSIDTYTEAIGRRLNSLHQKKTECMTRYYDLYNLCNLQKDEEEELRELITEDMESQRERAEALFNKDKGEI